MHTLAKMQRFPNTIFGDLAALIHNHQGTTTTKYPAVRKQFFHPVCDLVLTVLSIFPQSCTTSIINYIYTLKDIMVSQLSDGE